MKIFVVRVKIYEIFISEKILCSQNFFVFFLFFVAEKICRFCGQPNCHKRVRRTNNVSGHHGIQATEVSNEIIITQGAWVAKYNHLQPVIKQEPRDSSDMETSDEALNAEVKGLIAKNGFMSTIQAIQNVIKPENGAVATKSPRALAVLNEANQQTEREILEFFRE